MNTLEMKGGLLELISKVEDKKLLSVLYEMIQDIISQNNNKNDWWDELSTEEQKELDKSIEESENDTNLISNEEVFKKYRKWQKK